ncbi:MAG: 1-acyl-sn-glycerol-3-phosphate acyltransferase [Acidimicrobiales bacterium]|nr:1-acyl-sn-glycerol-3-phosphate acyltransferase [Acidimicrobiales bacterium]
MVTWYLIMECFGVLVASVLWVSTFGGYFVKARWSQHTHGRVQYVWTSSILFGVRVFLGGHVIYPNCSDLQYGPFIIVAQHRSFFDATIPSVLTGMAGGDVILRHILKSDLLISPSLDMFGHRLPNYFVTRNSGNPEKELESIQSLSQNLGNDACVIFPEGTFYSIKRFDKALSHIRKTEPDRLTRVQGLQHVLPIHPGGLQALIQAAPEADLVFIGHRGFEAFGSFQEILQNIPFLTPVHIYINRVSNTEIPTDEDQRLKFLDEKWLDIDRWNDNISKKDSK